MISITKLAFGFAIVLIASCSSASTVAQDETSDAMSQNPLTTSESTIEAAVTLPSPEETLTPTTTERESQTSATSALEPELRVLFIGNSFTHYRIGLDQLLEELAASANPSIPIEADAVVVGGVPLEHLWEFSNARESIQEGGYDVVVLQEDLPLTDVDTFQEYARRFEVDIGEAGARPVLYMAWAYKRLDWISMDEIAQAHFDIGDELDIDVAPVGLAFERATEDRPELNMLVSDEEHSSIYGTYLAALVIYATVLNEDPSMLSYWPEGITEEEAAVLKRVAWETIQDY